MKGVLRHLDSLGLDEGVLLVFELKTDGPSSRVDVELPCIRFSTLEMQKMISVCPKQFSLTIGENIIYG